MKIQIDASALAETTWRQYAVRFVFGGLVTVLAGILAKQFGPVIGGLFLAFPAIFPASATLIEKHQQDEKKEQVGLKSPKPAAEAVSMDAAGAAIGSVGLAVFAALVWRFLSGHSAPVVIGEATVAWLAVSFLLWKVRQRL